MIGCLIFSLCAQFSLFFPANLNTYVAVQGDAVESLANQVDVVRTRLQVAAETVGQERLSDCKLPMPVEPARVEGADAAATSGAGAGKHKGKKASKAAATGGVATSPTGPSAGPASFLASEGNFSQRDIGSPDTQSRRRATIEERMSQLDDVGVCLAKEVVRGKKDTSGVGAGASAGGGAGSSASSAAGGSESGSVSMYSNPIRNSNSAFASTAASDAPPRPPTLDMKRSSSTLKAKGKE